MGHSLTQILALLWKFWLCYGNFGFLLLLFFLLLQHKLKIAPSLATLLPIFLPSK